MTIWVLVGVATVPVGGPVPLICTPGVPVLEKKPVGYVSVMVLPVASAPPAVVVNENVAAADVLPADDDDVANDKRVGNFHDRVSARVSDGQVQQRGALARHKPHG